MNDGVRVFLVCWFFLSVVWIAVAEILLFRTRKVLHDVWDHAKTVDAELRKQCAEETT